ncbi:MAG TPA: 50S ribosomal protein L13 [bacterium]|nr:50S ribosomal protein L13 [bacterium]HOR57254.1 50S ribosomal protein L13 [bacterium]
MAARKTHKIDASGKILGRLAVEIAKLLRGKDKVDFTLNTDKGDQVVVFNCDKVKITGRKIETKKYYRHSGYIGNLKEKSYTQTPSDKVLYSAVKGMLPDNRLRQRWLKRLKLYNNEIPQLTKKDYEK